MDFAIKMKAKSLLISLILCCFVHASVFAADSFIVRKIKVQGLHRVTYATVMSYLPIKVGDRLEAQDSNELIKTLYDTGFFTQVQLDQQGNTLIIKVVERPTISAIHISGNDQIKTKDLLKVFKSSGVAVGLPIDYSVLNQLKQGLAAQYNNLGRYSTQVGMETKEQSRHRVEINVTIDEGKVAKIRRVTILGNKAFNQKTLLKQFKLGTSNLFSVFTQNDEYSREKLNADLESLQSYYMDHGYIKFKVSSAQVSITPDKRYIYITITVHEGPLYTVSDHSIKGNTLTYADSFEKLVQLHKGDLFSRKHVLGYATLITTYLQNRGYAQARVVPQPTVDEKSKTVFIKYLVMPGRLSYVRRIVFLGNYKTADNVLRREMRQQEGSLFSKAKLNLGKRRLSNLGYLNDVTVKTQPVPGHANQVDVKYQVKETSSATINFKLGYSDQNGLLAGITFSQKNFMGTGKSVGVNINRSEYVHTYAFNYFNPYYTRSGIGRGFSVSASETFAGKVNLAAFTTKSYSLQQAYSIPLTENDHLSFSYGYTNTDLNIGTINGALKQFIENNGTQFDLLTLNFGWTHNTYDRAMFPRKGVREGLTLTGTLPVFGDRLNFYKLAYNFHWYYPLGKYFIFKAHANLGYGNGYGDTKGLPFFNHFYAGGMDTVRGFETNTLGPRNCDGFERLLPGEDPKAPENLDKCSNDSHIGGNILTVAGASLIFPNFISETLRTGIFVDAGNVYDDKFEPSELRYSAGLSVVWLSPMGLLRFYIGKALNKKPGDITKTFDFSVGTSF